MLFGHQNDDTNQAADATPASSDTVNPLAVDPVTGASLPAVPVDPVDTDVPSSVLDQPATPPQPGDDVPVTAPVVDTNAPESTEEAPAADPVSPFAAAPSFQTEPPAANDAVMPHAAEADPAPDDLLSMKQQALSQLSPLIGQLDQTPEEKFRTTMMMIQSTDNQSLLKDAYDAAQAITDEKARAQALLDIVNEINYFTQPKSA